MVRTAIMRIVSDMLDNPRESGIYNTTHCYDQLEALIKALMAAPEVMQLSGSEAVFGFCAWLTTADEFENPAEIVPYGPTQDSAPWAEMAGRFIATNKLTEPREMWDQLLTHPGSENDAAQKPG